MDLGEKKTALNADMSFQELNAAVGLLGSGLLPLMACHLIFISTFIQALFQGNSIEEALYEVFCAADIVIYLCLVYWLFYLTLKDSSVSFKDFETCCVIEHL